MAVVNANCCICQKLAAQLKETAPLLRTVVGTPPIMLVDLLEQCIGANKAKRFCQDTDACICKCCQSKLLEYYEATMYVLKKRKEFKGRIKPQSIASPETKATLPLPFLDVKPKIEPLGPGSTTQSSCQGPFLDPLDKDRQDDDDVDMAWCSDNRWHDEDDFETSDPVPAVAAQTVQLTTVESNDKPPLNSEDNEPLAAIKMKMMEERANRYCRECEVECPSEEVYRLHVKKFHPTEFSTKANFYCAQCSLQLDSDDVYRQHMVAVHQRNGAEFQCNACGRGFNTHTQLITHSASHTAHTCTICGKTLSHRRGLLRHMETHSTEKKHQCAECGNKYPTTSSLKKHMMIHSDTRNHQCPTCGNRFRSASHLKRHQNTHTSSSGGGVKKS